MALPMAGHLNLPWEEGETVTGETDSTIQKKSESFLITLGLTHTMILLSRCNLVLKGGFTLL